MDRSFQLINSFGYLLVLFKSVFSFGASMVAQIVKNLPAMGKTQVQFLGWEDPLEKEISTHSNILA